MGAEASIGCCVVQERVRTTGIIYGCFAASVIKVIVLIVIRVRWKLLEAAGSARGCLLRAVEHVLRFTMYIEYVLGMRVGTYINASSQASQESR